MRYDISNGELHIAVLLERAIERGMRFHSNAVWNSDESFDAEMRESLGGELIHDSRYKHREIQVFDLPASVVQIGINRPRDSTPNIEIDVFCASRHAADVEVARLMQLLPVVVDAPTGRIPVTFWSRSRNGARQISRKLEAAEWADISGNYPDRTRSALGPLMTEMDRVLRGGRLLLWHGPAGTGKTSALRTLARENSHAIRLEYVLDPESFFGTESEYYVDVLFDEEGEEGTTRLLVLEDCDELLSADAKQRAGQGLARLLNLVDGLIGQGLEIAVLITTNEPLIELHQAVTRPGRCGAAVGFELFESDAAARWMAANEVIGSVPDRFSLADLFALRDHPGSARPRRLQRIGFAPAGTGAAEPGE